MASRRDQLHSYQFMVQRVVSALVFRKTDPDQSPFRRAGGAVFASVMVAVLALAVTGVIGFITDGTNSDITDGKAIIQEKETGSRYVYVDGALHPVLNFTSAALITGNTTMISRSRSSLAALRRGAPVGIPGAPDSMPDKGKLLSGEWALCSRPGTGAPPTSVMYVGSQPAQGVELGPDQAVVAVLRADGQQPKAYLVANGHRFDIEAALLPAVNVAGGLDDGRVLDTEAAFVNALPKGQPIAVPQIEGLAPARSAADSALPGAKIGKLYADPAGHRYVALKDGWAEVTPLQGQLIQSVTKDVTTTPVPSPASLGPASAAKPLAVGTPDSPVLSAIPRMAEVQQGGSACATVANQSDAPRVLVDATVPESAGMKTADVSVAGADLADEVIVEPGHAAVVESMVGKEGKGTVGLVNDLGVFYAFSDRALLGTFGYAESDVVKLPSLLIGRLPIGPTLDPAAAKQNAIKSQ